MVKKKYQVFIASTKNDMEEERRAAVQAILGADHIPAGMELFTAGSGIILDVVKKWIDESDIFMLMIGGRYGLLEPTSNLSYSEFEYNYAVERGKPVFTLILTEQGLNKKVKEHGIDFSERQHPLKRQAFIEKVSENIVDYFDEPRDIESRVLKSLVRIKEEYEDNLVGWVAAKDWAEASHFVDEIKKLKAERILCGVNIAKSPYRSDVMLPKARHKVIYAGGNLRGLLATREKKAQLIAYIKSHPAVTVMLLLGTYEAIDSFGMDGKLHLELSVEDLYEVRDQLTSSENERLVIHFDAGPSTLSAMMIDPDEDDGVIVLSPRWARDYQPEKRLFCVIEKKEQPVQFDAIFSSVFLMTQPGDKHFTLEQMKEIKDKS